MFWSFYGAGSTCETAEGRDAYSLSSSLVCGCCRLLIVARLKTQKEATRYKRVANIPTPPINTLFSLFVQYFRDAEGQDVLLFVDNIFRFTQAGAEVSALLGRIPSAVGYQPTLATDMGMLQVGRSVSHVRGQGVAMSELAKELVLRCGWRR